MAYKTKMDEIINYLKKYDDYKNLLNYIKNNQNNIPFDDDILFDIVKLIIDNNLSFKDGLIFVKAKSVYDIVVGDNKDNYSLFLQLFVSYYKSNIEIYRYEIMYNLFSNKDTFKLVYNEFLKILQTYNEKYHFEIKNYFYNYIVHARKYYLDETAFLSSILNFIEDIKLSLDKGNLNNEIKNIKNKHIEESKRIAGVYEIDEELLKKLPNYIKNLKEELNNIDSKQKNINELVNPTLDTIQKEIKKLQNLKEQLIKKTSSINQESGQISTISNEEELLAEYANIELRTIKEQINNRINIKITDSEIDKDLIERIIYEFKMNKEIKIHDYNKFIYYYYAKYNGTEDLYNKIIKNVSINNLSWYWFEKDLVEKFKDDEDLYLDLIMNKDSLLYHYHNADAIELLISLLKINNEFNCTSSISVKEAVKYFTLEEIANGDEKFLNNIENTYNGEYMQYFKQIYEINPDFNIYFPGILLPNKVFSVEQIAYFDKEEQQLLCRCFSDDWKCNTYNIDQADEEEIEILKKIILELDEKEEKKAISRNLHRKFERDLLDTVNITLEEAISLPDDDFDELVGAFRIYLNEYKDNTIIEIQKAKSKMKKIVSKFRK